ncbi:hypothetical protein GGI43DRAFT_430345 [Trichoderma evansii]
MSRPLLYFQKGTKAQRKEKPEFQRRMGVGYHGGYPGLGFSTFYETNEAQNVCRDLVSLYGNQPLLLIPRTEWPNHATAGTMGTLPITTYVAGKLYAATRRIGIYSDYQWADQLEQAHGFLTELRSNHMTSNFRIIALLQAGLRDLEEIIAIAPAEMQCPKSVKIGKWKKQVQGIGYGLAPEDFKKFAYGKRFYASFIHFDYHFGALIWDRAHGALYLFDSGLGREGRARQAVFVWRQYLDEMGYRGTFDFFLVPCTLQRDGYECGYFALYWLITTLRGLTGMTLSEIIAQKETTSLIGDASGWYKKTTTATFELRVRDWCVFDGTRKSMQDYEDIVFQTLQALAGNELGIISSEAPLYDDGRSVTHWALKQRYEKGETHITLSAGERHTCLGGWTTVEHALSPLEDDGQTYRTFHKLGPSDQSTVTYTLPPLGPDLTHWRLPLSVSSARSSELQSLNGFSDEEDEEEEEDEDEEEEEDEDEEEEEDEDEEEEEVESQRSNTSDNQNKNLASDEERTNASSDLSDPPPPSQDGSFHFSSDKDDNDSVGEREPMESEITIPDSRNGKLWTIAIPNVAGLQAVRDREPSDRDERNMDAVLDGGSIMTLELQHHLGDSLAKQRPALYIEASDSYFSLAPPGLMDESCWDRIHDEILQPEAKRRKLTRDERMKARDARRKP